MRIALTVHGSRDGSATTTDVVLETSPASELAEAAARLAALTGGDADRADAAEYVPTLVEIDGVKADRRGLLGQTGLRDGSHVVLDGAAAEAAEDYGLVPRTALLEIRAVGGAGAGRVWRLGLGSHFAGSGPDCTVRWAGFPAGHTARLTVRPDGSVLVSEFDHADSRPGGPEPAARPIRVVPPAAVEPDTAQPADKKAQKAAAKEAAKQARMEPPKPQSEDAGPGRFAVGVNEDFELAGTVLRVSPPALADADVRRSERGLGLDYNRPPRIMPPLAPNRFRMPSVPVAQGKRPFAVITMLAPMVMGFAMVFLFHSYFYLVFTLFSPVFAITNLISDRRTGRKSHRLAMIEYRRTKARREVEIAAAVADERVLRNQASPDPASLGQIALGPGTRLWERRRADGDHLTARVGTAEVPALVVVDHPGNHHQQGPEWRVPAAPLSLDLAGLGVTGLAGPPAAVRDLARWLVVQAGVLQSPRDVQIHLLTDVESEPDWDWLRWLPHARFPEHHGSLVRVGNDPETVANRVAELGSVVNARTQARGSAITSVMFAEPDVVVIVDGARRLREVPGMVQILKDGPAVRVFFVCLDQREGLLPEECAAVVALEDSPRPGGYYATVRQRGSVPVPDVRVDAVSAAWCDTVARAVAPIRDVTSEDRGMLPDSVALLDLLGLEPPEADRIAAGWERRPASTAFILGAGYDGPAVFDLVTDGPHALIGGTTGSGKSELLQAMVAALATANRPDELVFVLVDYKGGSAFRDCVRLAHTLGMVTDLDDHLVDRALTSLGAELRRREQVLAAAGAKDHPEYQAMRARDPELAPLPRLVIVIDEFATLAREVPDFVHGVVSISQRGRSLGLHLVLATQRPAGAVTADIRANTNLRISLRMTDGTESRDVIDTTDAAGISASTPGRALARLGHQMVVPFQTGYAGAARPVDLDAGEPDSAPPPPSAAAAMPWQRLGRRLPPTALSVAGAAAVGKPADVGPTDLSELVSAINEAAALVGCEPGPSPWLAPLPTTLLLDDVPQIRPLGTVRHGTRLIPVSYGLDDLPARQAQAPLVFNPDRDGHLYFVGSARSGRTQALRTLAGALARTVSTADVHMYGIDAGGGALTVLESLPHCGAVVQRADRERIERLLTRLVAELTRRQDLLTVHNAANLAELRETMPPGEVRPAHVVVFVDGWEALNTAIGEFDNGRLVEMFTQLIREGAAAGVHIVVSGDRALLNGKLSSLNEDKFVLRMNDRSDYMLIGMSHSDLPTVVPPGRGWRSDDCTESQIALLAPDPSGAAQAEALRKIGETARERDKDVSKAARPYPIAPLPSSLTFAQAWERMPAEPPRPLWALLGLSGDDIAPHGVDLAARGCVVLGPAGTGRSTVLATMAVSLLAGGTGLVAITPRESPLRRLAGQPRVRVLTAPQLTGPEITEALAEVGTPAAVLIDDTDLLLHTAADNTLRDLIATGRDEGIGLAAAGAPETFVQAVLGWAAELRRSRTGVLLAPQSAAEGDCIGVRLPQDLVRRPARFGRGLTGDAATGSVLSLLIPHTELK